MKIQQGDVVLRNVKSVVGKRLNHLTLAVGESTGHHHTITEGDAELYEQDGKLYLHVESDTATLTHQEHDVVTIPRGDYAISIVREKDWVNLETKKVID